MGEMEDGAELHVVPLRQRHVIAGVGTSVAAFIGAATQGPVGEAVLVESWLGFESTFGGMFAGVYLGYAVWQFFENGGSQAYVVRLAGADPSVILFPNTAPFEAALTGPAGYVALQQVGFNLLCVPGENTAAVISALQGFCAAERAFLVVDAAQTAVVGGGGIDLAVTGPADGAGVSLAGVGAENSGFYFPWVVAADPQQAESTVVFPPSGFVAGIYAASDASRGVWKAPAGVDATVNGALGLQYLLTDAQDAALTSLGVNCLRSFAVYGSVVWGARTIAGSDAAGSEWKYVPVRRLALFVEASLEQGLQWVVFETNGEALWGEIRLSVGTFLQGLYEQGAFVGTTVEQAYFLKCDGENNPQSSVDAGVVNITVGFAPLYPAEFVVIEIQQMVGS